jgi:hypothetical protein
MMSHSFSYTYSTYLIVQWTIEPRESVSTFGDTRRKIKHNERIKCGVVRSYERIFQNGDEIDGHVEIASSQIPRVKMKN